MQFLLKIAENPPGPTLIKELVFMPFKKADKKVKEVLIIKEGFKKSNFEKINKRQKRKLVYFIEKMRENDTDPKELMKPLSYCFEKSSVRTFNSLLLLVEKMIKIRMNPVCFTESISRRMNKVDEKRKFKILKVCKYFIKQEQEPCFFVKQISHFEKKLNEKEFNELIKTSLRLIKEDINPEPLVEVFLKLKSYPEDERKKVLKEIIDIARRIKSRKSTPYLFMELVSCFIKKATKKQFKEMLKESKRVAEKGKDPKDLILSLCKK